MELKALRTEIDSIDQELVALFRARMEVSAQVADIKKEQDLPIYVPSREQEVLSRVAQLAGPDLENDIKALYSLLFDLSRGYQSRRNGKNSPFYQQISSAIENTPRLFPQAPTVACQGIEGAYSQRAAQKMIKNPQILYLKSLFSVFQAVDQGLCRYGVISLENSTVGSARQVYDLLLKHHFFIVRTYRLRADHSLLAKPGTVLQDIREIYSHQHAFNQCGAFLQGLKNVNLVAVGNTAEAAKLVASGEKTDIAAICDRGCASLYGLDCLVPSIQDRDNNRTRFICFGRDLEIYPGSDRTSLMLILDHSPGALSRVLTRVASLGINVTKVETRPIPHRDFALGVLLDLETSVYADEFVELMCELDELCQEFRYLGSYREVV